MKCIGSDNPPCARCAKAGRECIVQRPPRPSHPSGTSTPSSHVRSADPPQHLRLEEQASRQFSIDRSTMQAELARPSHSFSPINSGISTTNQPVLPSIYTTPPYSTVFNQPGESPNQAAENLDFHRSWKRRRIGHADQSPRSLTPADPNNNPIPEKDIIQYIDM
jgi:hypothetical protein